MSGRDYTKYSFWMTLLVIALLVLLGLVPSGEVGGVRVKRVNILSDIITYADMGVAADSALSVPDGDFLAEADRVEADAALTGTDVTADRTETWDLLTGAGPGGNAGSGAAGDSVFDVAGIIQFEDFITEGRLSVAGFSRLLGDVSRSRVVRIAVLGDSFTEGDLITADIREQLQELYGGQGVGFVPFGTPIPISRPTVAHEFAGWTNYNLINRKNTPEEYQGRYFVSGVVSVPGEGARSAYKGAAFRRHIWSWSRARLIFTSEGATTLYVAVNDSIERTFTPAPGPEPQQITLNGNGMRSLEVSVSHPGGFVGYGVVLESARGVAVDNYSIRGNSGLALFGTESRTNARIGRMLGYDMVVLQYGLNAMDPDNVNYAAYGEQLARVVNYMKNCFPGAAIVLMGVGDRSTMRDGAPVTMAAVGAMVAQQRKVARECGIAFWDTFRAMGGENSMARFVEWGWAAKDYTHLSYPGGRHIATKFVDALRYAGHASVPSPEEEGIDTGGGWSYGGTSVQLDMTAPVVRDTAVAEEVPADTVLVETIADSVAIPVNDSVIIEPTD